MTTTITIGRNVKNEPLATTYWQSFREEVTAVPRSLSLALYFQGEGLGWSDEWGAEDAYTLVVEDPASWEDWQVLLDELAYLARFYGQDAIAVTGFYMGGMTLFVPER